MMCFFFVDRAWMLQSLYVWTPILRMRRGALGLFPYDIRLYVSRHQVI